MTRRATGGGEAGNEKDHKNDGHGSYDGDTSIPLDIIERGRGDVCLHHDCIGRTVCLARTVMNCVTQWTQILHLKTFDLCG